MYIVKEYLTNETVAIVSRKADAMAMIRTQLPNQPRLIVEKQ